MEYAWWSAKKIDRWSCAVVRQYKHPASRVHRAICVSEPNGEAADRTKGMQDVASRSG
jgi:hypothetical protein